MPPARIINGGGFCLGIAFTLLLAMAVNAYGLTTFGKSQNNQPQAPPPPPAPQGRICQYEQDCSGIQNTSCVPDPHDNNLRCLCGDYVAPVNGVCKSKYKGPKHACTANEECVEGAECAVNKVSGARGGAPKICKCLEGIADHGQYCGGAGSQYGQELALSLLLASLVIARTNLLY